MNRLNLDFTLVTAEEREFFLEQYLSPDPLDSYVERYDNKKYPFPFRYKPSKDELETMANYMLYGKSKSSEGFDLTDKKGNNGTWSVVDAGYVQIPTRNSPWQRKQEDSLDSMFEAAQETGSAVELQGNMTSNLRGKGGERVRLRKQKETFSRTKTRHALCPGYFDENGNDIEPPILDIKNDLFLLDTFESLWHQIDIMEYAITTYELNHNRRKKEIREELENRLTEEDKDIARRQAKSLNMYTWSKQRKLLVELRQQQYALRDSFAPVRLPVITTHYSETEPSSAINFKAVMPAGLKTSRGDFDSLLFMEDIEQEHFNSEFIDQLLQLLIEQDRFQKTIESTPEVLSGVFDFRNLEHIAYLIYARHDLLEINPEILEENEYLNQFLNTLDYYIKVAHLEPLHRDILKYKAEGMRNEDIALNINRDYDKTYSANYISTLFRSKCCGGIVAAAEQHWDIIDKLTLGEEEFKRCNTCGRTLLRDPNNYVRKSRSSDGLASRCKICDKAARQAKK